MHARVRIVCLLYSITDNYTSQLQNIEHLNPKTYYLNKIQEPISILYSQLSYQHDTKFWALILSHCWSFQSIGEGFGLPTKLWNIFSSVSTVSHVYQINTLLFL